ncbi:MAG: hypothetical protein JRF69_09615 [Deltaproteobacteria bacterium]|nr:hypothetical protein [Deltaproteobacteria bacterium]
MKRVHDLFLHLLLPDIRNAPQYTGSSQRYRPSRRSLSVLMSAHGPDSSWDFQGESRGSQREMKKLHVLLLYDRGGSVS